MDRGFRRICLGQSRNVRGSSVRRARRQMRGAGGASNERLTREPPYCFLITQPIGPSLHLFIEPGDSVSIIVSYGPQIVQWEGAPFHDSQYYYLFKAYITSSFATPIYNLQSGASPHRTLSRRGARKTTNVNFETQRQTYSSPTRPDSHPSQIQAIPHNLR